jgi:hypothetical protein
MRLAFLFAMMMALPGAARAGSTFLVSPPVIEHDDIALIFGGLSDDGVALKPTSVQVEFDGAPAAPPRSLGSLFDHSAAEKSPRASSPLVVGLVYLWVKDVPAAFSDALLEGVTGFCRRLPDGTQAYATLYGRKRQPIPKLKASELASDLHDVSFLVGDRPNLADAIRLTARNLASDESPLKILLVVTDGRDHADPTGEQPADFVALADELARAQVRVLLVSFPAPEADAEMSARNLAALVGSGLQRSVEQPAELQSTLESLGQVVADLRQVRVDIPWSWRAWGGTHRLRLNLQVNGKARTLDVGTIVMPAGHGRWWLVAAGLLMALLLLGGSWVVRARRSREQDETVLSAAGALIEQGVTARRALITLSRRFPKDVTSLAALNASALEADGPPALQTRAGRRRFEEMVALLKRGDEARLSDDLAAALAQVLAEDLPADQAALRLAAQISEDELAGFSRLGLEPLASALRKAGERHPLLATPRSRALALAVQEALRLPQTNAKSVGWLVRAAGPGKRGETLCLGKARVVLGRSPGCDVHLSEDSQIAQEHAAINESRGQFTIEPLQGWVKVEGQRVEACRPLHDGDTLEMGDSRFVWKYVGR